MELQKCRPIPQGTNTGSIRVLLRTQGLLHSSDSVLIPAGLLLSAVCMVVYQHMMNQYDTTVRNFLLMILLSMFPLAFLEKKLLACTDPVGLLFKFSTKVLLMHAGFLTLRVISGLIDTGDTGTFSFMTLIQLAGACILLPTIFGFRLSRECIWEHRDVLCVGLGAFLVAGFSELIDVLMWDRMASAYWSSAWYRKRYIKLIFVAASDYMEIFAFLPAMWMVSRSDLDAIVKDVDVCEAQRRAFTLFAFMIAFYLSEDLLSAYEIAEQSYSAAAGHVAHFLLVLDFASFILAHLYDPEKYIRFMHKFWKFILHSEWV